MRYSSTARYVRQYDGCPADVFRSVDVRVGLVPAREATELGLAGPIVLGGVPTAKTGSARVVRVNSHDHYRCELGFVLKKRPQLGKGPAMQNDTLFPPSPDPDANALEILQGNTVSGAFGFRNDLLGNAVVHAVAGNIPNRKEGGASSPMPKGRGFRAATLVKKEPK